MKADIKYYAKCIECGKIYSQAEFDKIKFLQVHVCNGGCCNNTCDSTSFVDFNNEEIKEKNE